MDAEPGWAEKIGSMRYNYWLVLRPECRILSIEVGGRRVQHSIKDERFCESGYLRPVPAPPFKIMLIVF